MKTSIKSAVWAGAIAVISGSVIVAGAPRELAFLTLPSWPGFFIAFFLGIGPATEGIPTPTNIAVHVLTFALWWLIIALVLSRWKRQRSP
jgi:hypothetical protein